MHLKIDNLCVSYGAITALDDVSIQIGAGEIVALIGSNGAGKTTLLRTISGLIAPKSGGIAWQDSQSLVGLRPDQIVRHGISHSPEGRQIFPGLTVRENLMLGAYQQRDKVLIAGTLDRCYRMFPILAERKEQKAGTLSGGEQQMLAMGRALMQQPKLLLLDEPSLGLAPIIVRQIFDIIREINKEGVTIFLVEQNARMALNVAHRAYVLQTGKVLMADTAANLAANPQVQEAYLGG